MGLAYKLGKFEHEILENLTPSEFQRWRAYFILEREAQERAEKRASGKMSSEEFRRRHKG